MLSILLVDDDLDVRESLCATLNESGFICNSVSSLVTYNAWRSNQSCDVVIVNRTLSDGDGLEVLKFENHAGHTPVIMMSDNPNPADKILCYNLDCELYLHKPVSNIEVVAIINNITRRNIKKIIESAWLLNRVASELIGPKHQVFKLTHRELNIMLLFAQTPGELVTREQLCDILKLGEITENYKRLEVIMRRLRNKVESLNVSLPLQTVYGQGYVFSEHIHIKE